MTVAVWKDSPNTIVNLLPGTFLMDVVHNNGSRKIDRRVQSKHLCGVGTEVRDVATSEEYERRRIPATERSRCG